MKVNAVRLYVQTFPLRTMIAGVLIHWLQADLFFPHSKKNYHPVLFETKVYRRMPGNNMVFSENQYPVFRGLAE
ncbi:hypothetical protein QFZ51_005354 [Chitinophaga sp. W3I9]|uniref:hypothetical protein n=1 Tax=unclassified Chitinophaga TaxID=2619133 RepID=UPI003D225DC7